MGLICSQLNERLIRHFFVMSKEYSADSLQLIFTTTLKTFLQSHAFDLEVFDDIFVNKLVLSTVEIHHKMTGLFRKGLDTFHYDFNLRHQASGTLFRLDATWTCSCKCV